MTGNLAEFVLAPKFSYRDKMFGCHVEPVPRYKIYDIEYTVLHNGAPINNRRLSARRLFDGHHPVKAIAQ